MRRAHVDVAGLFTTTGDLLETPTRRDGRRISRRQWRRQNARAIRAALRSLKQEARVNQVIDRLAERVIDNMFDNTFMLELLATGTARTTFADLAGTLPA